MIGGAMRVALDVSKWQTFGRVGGVVQGGGLIPTRCRRSVLVKANGRVTHENV